MNDLVRFRRGYIIDPVRGCWLWQRGKNAAGYGYFGASGRNHRAHRWAYEQHIGPIPDGLVLDHLCRVKNCVNPAHLEPVTTGENKRRGNQRNQHMGKTHCHRGHPLEGGNVYFRKNGWRRCRACMKQWPSRHGTGRKGGEE